MNQRKQPFVQTALGAGPDLGGGADGRAGHLGGDTALTTIRLNLGSSITELEWIVNAYTLSFAVLLMTASALADRFGRPRLFLLGIGLFTAMSAACALAPSIGWLIVARAVQGPARR